MNDPYRMPQPTPPRERYRTVRVPTRDLHNGEERLPDVMALKIFPDERIVSIYAVWNPKADFNHVPVLEALIEVVEPCQACAERHSQSYVRGGHGPG